VVLELPAAVVQTLPELADGGDEKEYVLGIRRAAAG
jgi:hypothetical protein